MATNKHAMIRFQALDKCFSNPHRQFYIEDLVAACNEALADFYLGKEDVESDTLYYVRKRTIFSDIQYMESSKGWEAPIGRFYEGHRCYYKYTDKNFSINKRDFSEAELATLDEALIMLNRFKGAEGFDWVDEFIANFEDKLGRQKNTVPVIGYEKNQYLRGLDNLSVLYNHIVNKQVIKITYDHFKKGTTVHFVHPYYLKQYNNRWFLLGVTERDKNIITNFPLDRIIGIEPVKMAYSPNDKFDFEEYFEDVIGVSVPRNGAPEKVRLKFDKERYPYITTKPLHPSQKEIDRENCIVQIEVYLNKELEALILSFGDQVEVLEPASLRENIKEKVSNLILKY